MERPIGLSRRELISGHMYNRKLTLWIEKSLETGRPFISYQNPHPCEFDTTVLDVMQFP